MSKARKKIIEIIQSHSISADEIEEIILKDTQKAIIGINTKNLDFDKAQIKEIAEKIKSQIEGELAIKQATVILIQDEKSKKKSTKKNEIIAKSNFFTRIIEKFRGKNPKAKKNKAHAQDPANKSANPTQQNSEIPVIGVKKIIAIASAKGGVGKSTFATNLAVSLSKIGHKVAIVDADIYGPSIANLMNLNQKPETSDKMLLPIISQNIKCISIGSMIDEGEAGVWRGPMITKILHQLIRSVKWNFDDQEVDYMIIDMPPGTGDVYLSLAQNFPISGVVAISTPQSVAVADVVRSIDCFKKLKIPILGLVQNMAFFEKNGEKNYIFGKDNAKKMAQKFDIKFLGNIPLSQDISDSNEKRKPIASQNPSSKESLNFGCIAEEIIDSL